jgi:VWFA-related protein
MRRCSSLLPLAFLVSAFAYGQASSAPAPVTAPVHTSPTVSESQPALDVDRDPIVSPDASDNLPVSLGHPNPSQAIHRDRGVYTLRRNVDEVVLNCTVVDNHGHLVNDLSQDDFLVFEDNAPQKIVSFQHSDLPVSIGILVDNSGSMRDKRAAVVSAALDLVRASNRDDEAFIVNFSDEAFLDQDFTSSIAKLNQGLGHIQSAGGTALYDAVVAAANHLAEGARHAKQVLLIITDGEDDASSLNLEQAIHRVQDLQGPVVYSIGLLFGNDNTAGEVHRARRALELLSEQTGGLAFFPHSLSDVDSVAAEVAHDIRNQYTIGYHSTIPMSLGGYRIVRVEARAPHHGKLFVRTRAGYYPKTEGVSGQKAAAANAAQRDAGNPVQ